MAAKAERRKKVEEQIIKPVVKNTKPIPPPVEEDEEDIDLESLQEDEDSDYEDDYEGTDDLIKKRGRKPKSETSFFDIIVDRKVYRVSSDRYGWCISIRKKVKDGYVFVPSLYPTTFVSCLTTIRDQGVSTARYKSLTELITKISMINRELIDAIKGLKNDIPEAEYRKAAKELIKECNIKAL